MENKIKPLLPTAVCRNCGFRQTLKLVLYLEVRSLIYTFGQPNPQLTPSHKTLAENLTDDSKKLIKIRVKSVHQQIIGSKNLVQIIKQRGRYNKLI